MKYKTLLRSLAGCSDVTHTLIIIVNNIHCKLHVSESYYCKIHKEEIKNVIQNYNIQVIIDYL